MIVPENIKVIIALLLAALFAFLIVAGMQYGRFLDRRSDIFYCPCILPMEVVKGDIIFLDNPNFRIEIDRDETITSIQYNNSDNAIILYVERHYTLWDKISGDN